MNTRLFLLLLVGVAVQVTGVNAQRGYWVIESNVNSRNYTIVRVYDLSNQLIKETLLNKKVDIARGRDRRMLDRMLKITMKDHEAVMARRSRKNLKGSVPSGL